MARDIDRPEEVTDETADGVRDRRLHGGTKQRLDDEELARRTEEERVDAGVASYDPDEVPPATDTEPSGDVTETDAYQEELAEVRRYDRERRGA